MMLLGFSRFVWEVRVFRAFAVKLFLGIEQGRLFIFAERASKTYRLICKPILPDADKSKKPDTSLDIDGVTLSENQTRGRSG